MTIPRRLRLLQACRDHLYSEVKITLATDKELRALKQLSDRINRSANKQAKEQKKTNHNTLNLFQYGTTV